MVASVAAVEKMPSHHASDAAEFTTALMTDFYPSSATAFSIVGLVVFFGARAKSRNLEEQVQALRMHFGMQAVAFVLHAISMATRVRREFVAARPDLNMNASDLAVANAMQDVSLAYAGRGISEALAGLAVTLFFAVLPLFPFLTSLREFVTTHRLDLAARDAARDAAQQAK